MIHRSNGRMALCICLLAANLLFIWGNSLLPASASDGLSQWIYRLLGGGNLGMPEAQGHGLLRKLAHFSEFCALGALLGWLYAMLMQKKWTFIIPALVCGCTAACVDETLQFLSPGRSPGITDVGIDSLGVTVGIGLLCLGYTIYTKRKNHINIGGKQT